MLPIARIALAGWWQGPLLVALLFQLGWLQWLSLSVLAVVTLRQGAQSAAVALVATLVVTLLTTWMGHHTVIPVLGVLALLIVVAASLVLRFTVRLEWAVIVASVLVVIVVSSALALAPDAFEPYQNAFSQTYSEFVEAQARTLPSGEAENFRSVLALSPDKEYALLVMLLSTSVAFISLLALVIGRYWQAALFNPGGFGLEVRAYRIEPQLVFAMVAVWLLAQWSGVAVANSAQALWFPFVLGGICLFHWFAQQRRLTTPWYVLFYMMVCLMYVIVMVTLVVLAVLDSFFNVRQRLVATGK